MKSTKAQGLDALCVTSTTLSVVADCNQLHRAIHAKSSFAPRLVHDLHLVRMNSIRLTFFTGARIENTIRAASFDKAR